jgi:phosphoglycerol transferase MdoB-like AlkP superfamily enzyme
VAYSDNALRLFFQKAQRQPWFKNTLFVITADHVSGQIDPIYKTTLGHYCVPIILYAPGDTLLRGYDRERVVEQTDIMPTVLNYLHYDHPYLAFGQDMLTTPADSTFALHWVPEFNGYEFVQGNLLLQFDGQHTTAAYRFRTDPLLSHDILHTLPADSILPLERRMKSIIQQYMQRMNENKLTVGK